MQSKGVIKLLAILLAIACIYQLSFSLKARSVEKKAAEYAAKVSESDSLRQAAEIYYLDSVQNRPVYDLGFISFTYKEVKEKEINLGLDLKGGMNVMLEVQVEDVLKALAGDSAHDPMFEEAIARANKALKEGTNNYIGEFAKAYREVSGGAPLAALFVSPDRKDITPNSSDSEVEKILQEETDAAIDASFNILRSRIDHFGVTQPNIQRLPNSHRILVELPGVKEPERVRKLLQGTASLEFWTTYNNTELVRALEQADQLLRDELAAGATDAAVEETLTEEQPTAAGTEDTTESLIAEVQNNAPAAEEAASASGASRYTREEKLLEEAAQVLGLKTPPRVIESYDISNWGDGSSVCGMVVFKDGKPYRAGYRRFKMRTVAGTDDYASMAETLSRRAAEYEAARRGEKPDNETNQFATMPDLLLIDGGRGQVSAVKQALRGTALEHVPTFGMVKDDHHRTRAIVDDAGGEIAINRHRNIFTFVTNIQDETHRYANDYRKRMMHKKSYAATLTELPGVGPKTSAALLAHFKTVTAVKQASISDLEEVKGISHAKAENIYNALRQ